MNNIFNHSLTPKNPNTMKKLKGKNILVVLMLGLTFGLYNCTRHDQVLNLAPSNGTTLTSVKTTTPPTFAAAGAYWGGADANQWKSAPVLNVTATVPDVEGNNSSFVGYIGNSTPVTIQSMYDATNIYFLVTWKSAQSNLESSPWYFNPTKKLWAQGGAGITYDVNGEVTLQSFVSDQFTFLWNINGSSADFKTQGCFGACHQGVQTMVVDTNTGLVSTQTGNTMHTNGPNEKLDCWRARMYQVVNAAQCLDYYIDYDGGVMGGGGIHADQTVSNGGYPPTYSSNVSTNGTGGVTNKQTLTVTGTSKHVSVPIWVKTSDSYTNAALLLSDTLGAAVKVVAVDSNGVLTLSNGSTIDPMANTTYQKVGTGIGNGDQTTWIPGKVIAPYTGGQGDVAANGYWTGSSWQLMLKRALKTSDVLEQDVDFSPLTDQQFGIGVMFQAAGSINPADNQHAIMSGLNMTFKK